MSGRLPPFRFMIALALSLAGFIMCEAKAEEAIRFVAPRVKIEAPVDYVMELLKLALKNSGKEYPLAPTPHHIQQAGAIREMTSPKGQVDLIWTMTSDEREATLIPIRIPIDKGLFGWRIAFVRNENTNLFQSVKNLKDLQSFKAGQDQYWPDTNILQSNGLPVVTTTSPDSLINMLRGSRFDYFPRSALEIAGEFQIHNKEGIEIEKHVVLHYPSAFYFFVTPRRPQLAEDIRVGLEKAIADGSFEKLFQQYQLPLIEGLDIKHRVVIELKNPLVNNTKLPLSRTELWYRP